MASPCYAVARYEARLSFDTDFLIHFYDAANKPFLKEQQGSYFLQTEPLPLHAHTVYFRVYVHNPEGRANEWIRIGIQVDEYRQTEKLIPVSHFPGRGTWHTIQLSLV
ncbi:MAG TPA: hypothetical protein PKK69_05790 [Ferruginibacter sp.]|nr:hypothetical protein [Ferruginibacter sp.]